MYCVKWSKGFVYQPRNNQKWGGSSWWDWGWERWESKWWEIQNSTAETSCPLQSIEVVHSGCGMLRCSPFSSANTAIRGSRRQTQPLEESRASSSKHEGVRGQHQGNQRCKAASAAQWQFCQGKIYTYLSYVYEKIHRAQRRWESKIDQLLIQGRIRGK